MVHRSIPGAQSDLDLGKCWDQINTLSFFTLLRAFGAASSVQLGEPEQYESRPSCVSSIILSEEPISSSYVLGKWDILQVEADHLSGKGLNRLITVIKKKVGL